MVLELDAFLPRLPQAVAENHHHHPPPSSPSCTCLQYIWNTPKNSTAPPTLTAYPHAVWHTFSLRYFATAGVSFSHSSVGGATQRQQAGQHSGVFSDTRLCSGNIKLANSRKEMVASGKAYHVSAALLLTLASSPLPATPFVHQQCGFVSTAAAPPRDASSLSKLSRCSRREVSPRRLRRHHRTTATAAAEAARANTAAGAGAAGEITAEERLAPPGLESEYLVQQ